MLQCRTRAVDVVQEGGGRQGEELEHDLVRQIRCAQALEDFGGVIRVRP